MLLALHSQLNKYGLCLNSWAFFAQYFGKIFRLDIGQISGNLVKKAFATRQLAFLPLASRFTTFWFRHAKKSKF